MKGRHSSSTCRCSESFTHRSAKPVAKENTPSAVTDAGGGPRVKAKTEGSTKDGKASGSKSRGEHNVATHFANCHVCKMTETSPARYRVKPLHRVDGLPPVKELGDHITADHIVFFASENESRLGHRNALIIQDALSNWLQSFPTKNKDATETTACLLKCMPPQEDMHRQFQGVPHGVPEFELDA